MISHIGQKQMMVLAVTEYTTGLSAVYIDPFAVSSKQ